MMATPVLLIIVGPTAVGKTELSICLAQHYGTEIVSADARQFYQETALGTAQPTAEELRCVRHHLIDFLPVTQAYDVKQFEQDALRAVAGIHQSRSIALATGGSGLYINTLCYGIDDMPAIPPAIREQLVARWQHEGLATLVEELQRIDPAYHATVDLRNHRRVIRALEVCQATGRPYSSFRRRNATTVGVAAPGVAAPGAAALRPFTPVFIGLKRPRAELYQRINARVDHMMAQGLMEEARRLYPWRNYQALRTVGYQEIFPVFDGQYDEAEAIRLIKRNTRRYAKRQLTWFRKNEDIRWFDANRHTDDLAQEIIAYVAGEMQKGKPERQDAQ